MFCGDVSHRCYFERRTVKRLFEIADGDGPDVGIADVRRRHESGPAGTGDADSPDGKYGQRNQNKTLHLSFPQFMRCRTVVAIASAHCEMQRIKHRTEIPSMFARGMNAVGPAAAVFGPYRLGPFATGVLGRCCTNATFGWLMLNRLHTDCRPVRRLRMSVALHVRRSTDLAGSVSEQLVDVLVKTVQVLVPGVVFSNQGLSVRRQIT